MKIGPVRVAHPITLAPMEEHTNYPFRLLMKQFGASLVCTERVDAADVARRERRALRLLYTTTQESPRAGQISGGDPEVMAVAARVVEEQGFDIVDLNFECPIRRLINRGEGGALLAVADAFDVMTVGRPYNRSRSAVEALAECQAGVGSQFKAEAVVALERFLRAEVLAPASLRGGVAAA